MRTEQVNAAMEEAGRFMRAARRLMERVRNEPSLLVGPSKESGAVRRASLDLTRALAELRKR